MDTTDKIVAIALHLYEFLVDYKVRTYTYHAGPGRMFTRFIADPPNHAGRLPYSKSISHDMLSDDFVEPEAVAQKMLDEWGFDAA
jgi:hypothetical protein